MDKKDLVLNNYEKQFGKQPDLLVRACGRINVIGEHTDYNDGFVLPAAIDRHIYFAVGRSGDQNCHWFADDINQAHHFQFPKLEKSEKLWVNYLKGILDQFQRDGHDLAGINCVFGGNLPIGAGVSSSAAIEGGFALAVSTLFDLGYVKKDLASLAQRSSNTFVGMPCGIMDQFASLMGKQEHVIRLDCRSLDYQYFPFRSDDYTLLLVNSHVTHDLTESGYGDRVVESAAGLNVIKEKFTRVTSFRDVSLAMLEDCQSVMKDIVYRRCSYIIKEIQRVKDASTALTNSDFHQLGRLMYETHAGTKDEYEVSCPELDFLVDYAKNRSEVLGARMMGGGFGGCTINLVEKQHLELFKARITTAYHKKMGILPDTYQVNIVEGTSVV